MAKGKKKGWPTVGTVRVGDNKETGEKYTYIKLKDNVEILVDGEKISLNKNRNLRLERPTDKVEQLLERGIIDEAEAERRLEQLSEMAWLRYEIVAPPARE